MTKKSEKVQLIHPQGKHAPAISADNFNLFEKAILHVMKHSASPITWTQLEKGVKEYLAENDIEFGGSPGWFAVSVKMHLEATGVLERFIEKGKKLHRLKK
ncbi:MAG TPA: hypothetical protein PL009_06665 [Flavipsychrobacter sp.]|nr:hypothetical protein [Flavipsychrobacter sp.]